MTSPLPALDYRSTSTRCYTAEQMQAYGKARADAERDRFAELCDAAQAVITRWDSPSWKDQPHTAEFVGRLRAALKAVL